MPRKSKRFLQTLEAYLPFFGLAADLAGAAALGAAFPAGFAGAAGFFAAIVCALSNNVVDKTIDARFGSCKQMPRPPFHKY